MEVPWCDHAHGRMTGWSKDGDWWVNPCGKPSRMPYIKKVNGMRVDYHVFLGGPMTETEAFSTRMVLEDRELVKTIQGYECTNEIKYSETNPEVFARVWRYTGDTA